MKSSESPFQRGGLQRRLTGMILLCSALILLLASIFFVTTEISYFRQSLLDKSRSLAQIIGTNSRQALTFKRPFAAEDVLASLGKEQHVVRAYIFDKNRKPFAHYIKRGEGDVPEGFVNETCSHLPEALERFSAGHCFTFNHLAVFQPITSQGTTLGFIYLDSDLGGLYGRLTRYGLIVFGSLAGLLAFGVFVSTRLQKQVSAPIMDLAEKMSSVREERDFSVRMEDSSKDEIGLVCRGFNEMLAHLQDRETMLLHYQHNLEEMVEQRTKELEEARQAAEEASRAKSLFLANMSHEIRTPMSGVLGMTELMQKTRLDDHQKSLAETISNSGQTLLALLNDLLDYSKIEAGKFQLQMDDFDLHAEIEDSVFLLAERACGKKLDLVCRIRPDTPRRVKGDSMRVRQVLINLVANAIKFTDQGEVCVGVVPLKADDGRVHLSFEVRDTGVGISPEDKDKIFDSFAQGVGCQRRHAGGTGLGLAIASELISLMDGSISVESRPGEGSCFNFDLKFAPPEQPILPTSRAELDLQAERLLIVDDNASTREMIREFFQARGALIDQAGEAERAMTLLRKAARQGMPYTMVLIDATMPEQSALGLARQISQASDIPRTELVLMCQPGQDVAKEKLYECGIQGCLTKPIRATRLAASLRERFAMPEKKAAPPHGESESAAARPLPDTAVRQGTARILVAEDNPTVQTLLRLHLDSRGVESAFVENGRKAIESFSKGRYDAILMDCNMPEMDGLEATRMIRREGNSIPIIALSAHVDEKEIDGFFNAGMNDCLCKPFRQEQLYRILDKWLD